MPEQKPRQGKQRKQARKHWWRGTDHQIHGLKKRRDKEVKSNSVAFEWSQILLLLNEVNLKSLVS